MNQFELAKIAANKDRFDSKVFTQALAGTTHDYTVPTGKTFKPHRMKAKNFGAIAPIVGGNDGYTKYLYHSDLTESPLGKDSSVGSGLHDLLLNGGVISATQSKFGGASLYIAAGNWPFKNTDLQDTDILLADYTIDFWLYVTNAGLPQADCLGSLGNWTFEFGNSGLNFYCPAGSVTIPVTWGSALNTWVHFAMVRQGTLASFYVNGSLATTLTVPANWVAVGGKQFQIGRTSGNMAANFYLDEFRASQGIARWTSNFTPNTIAYGNSVPGQPRPTKLYFDMQNGANESMRIAELPISASDVEIDFATDVKESGMSIDGLTLLVPLSDVKNEENEIITLSTDSGVTDFTIEGTLYKAE